MASTKMKSTKVLINPRLNVPVQDYECSCASLSTGLGAVMIMHTACQQYRYKNIKTGTSLQTLMCTCMLSYGCAWPLELFGTEELACKCNNLECSITDPRLSKCEIITYSLEYKCPCNSILVMTCMN